MIPFYLKTFLIEVDSKAIPQLMAEQKIYKVIDSKNMDKFNVLFNGKLYDTVIGWESDFPPKVVLKSVSSVEKILLFDGMIYGYDSTVGFNRSFVVRGTMISGIEKLK